MGRNGVENRNFIHFFQWQKILCLVNYKTSVQEAKKEVLELQQVLDCAVTDLASDDPNGISMKEVDIFKSLFNKDDFFHTDTIWIIRC